jgi:hypothetical protein
MFLLGSAALAADEGQEATAGGWYLGAGAGRTHLTGSAGVSLPLTGDSEVHAERNSTAKVFLGYQFRAPVAVEVTYALCGAVRVSSDGPAAPSEVFDIRVWTVQGVGTFLKVGNAAFQARMGGLAWRAFPKEEGGNQGLGIAAGMNLKYDIGKNVAVRADFDVYRTILEASDFHWGANVVSVSIIGSFR